MVECASLKTIRTELTVEKSNSFPMKYLDIQEHIGSYYWCLKTLKNVIV
jgi:hypothetical protein